jgi:hypothetical protein
MLSIVQSIEEENHIPCLASVTESDEGGRVDFRSLAIDMSSAELGAEPSLGGVVEQQTHRDGAQVHTVIPGVFDTEDTSAEKDLQMFADALIVAGSVPNAKPMLVEKKLWIISDLWIPNESDEAVEEQLVCSTLRSALKLTQLLSLQGWYRAAGSVMGEEAVQAGFQERVEAIEQAVGEPPFGEEVGGTV